MIRLKFEIEFLPQHEVLARYREDPEHFPGVHSATHRHDVFVRITDPRFGDEFDTLLQVIRDFKWYKFLHPFKMAGYRLGRVMLWDEYNSSIIISIHRDW